MESNNKKKYEKLGMPYGTANGQLKKKLMFYMAIKLDMCKCFHCKEFIETIEEFSIEHKEPWLNSENPIEKFFDLNNIAFSHLKCNIEAGAKIPRLYATKEDKNKAIHIRLRNRPDAYANKLKLKREGYHRRKQSNVQIHNLDT